MRTGQEASRRQSHGSGNCDADCHRSFVRLDDYTLVNLAAPY
jgi:hypothetical protein